MTTKKTLAGAALLLLSLAGQAQEKVMNILKTDGTSTQTRVADLKQISFLTVDEGGQGIMVTTLSGATAAVLFDTNPVVTVSKSKLVITPSTSDAVEFEIADIAEIQFGETSDPTAISTPKGFSWVLQDGGALLRDIPEGAEVRVFALDGRCLPAPSPRGGELLLDRATLGSGIFVVKVGDFSAKIRL